MHCWRRAKCILGQDNKLIIAPYYSTWVFCVFYYNPHSQKNPKKPQKPYLTKHFYLKFTHSLCWTHWGNATHNTITVNLFPFLLSFIFLIMLGGSYQQEGFSIGSLDREVVGDQWVWQLQQPNSYRPLHKQRSVQERHDVHSLYIFCPEKAFDRGWALAVKQIGANTHLRRRWSCLIKVYKNKQKNKNKICLVKVGFYEAVNQIMRP